MAAEDIENATWKAATAGNEKRAGNRECDRLYCVQWPLAGDSVKVTGRRIRTLIAGRFNEFGQP
jgi:hypothetical protein